MSWTVQSDPLSCCLLLLLQVAVDLCSRGTLAPFPHLQSSWCCFWLSGSTTLHNKLSPFQSLGKPNGCACLLCFSVETSLLFFKEMMPEVAPGALQSTTCSWH